MLFLTDKVLISGVWFVTFNEPQPAPRFHRSEHFIFLIWLNSLRWIHLYKHTLNRIILKMYTICFIESTEIRKTKQLCFCKNSMCLTLVSVINSEMMWHFYFKNIFSGLICIVYVICQRFVVFAVTLSLINVEFVNE